MGTPCITSRHESFELGQIATHGTNRRLFKISFFSYLLTELILKNPISKLVPFWPILWPDLTHLSTETCLQAARQTRHVAKFDKSLGFKLRLKTTVV